jgi:hypothetical protein
VNQGFSRNAKSACEAEIDDFEVALLINEKVLRFKIPVDDLLGMTIVETIDDLEHE